MNRISLPIDDIRLLWRPRPHTPRLVVGILVRLPSGEVEFSYLEGPDLEEAKRVNFTGYPGFPLEKSLFSKNVMASFATRLPDPDRPDYNDLIRHWDAECEHDVFGVLAATGGLLPTDNFEFVPRIRPMCGVRFITEVAGFTYAEDGLLLRNATEDDPVSLIPNPSTPTDPHGVEVIYDGSHVGWIKRIHAENICRAIDAGVSVVGRIKDLKLNGTLRSVRLSVSYE